MHLIYEDHNHITIDASIVSFSKLHKAQNYRDEINIMTFEIILFLNNRDAERSSQTP